MLKKMFPKKMAKDVEVATPSLLAKKFKHVHCKKFNNFNNGNEKKKCFWGKPKCAVQLLL